MLYLELYLLLFPFHHHVSEVRTNSTSRCVPKFNLQLSLVILLCLQQENFVSRLLKPTCCSEKLYVQSRSLMLFTFHLSNPIRLYCPSGVP